MKRDCQCKRAQHKHGTRTAYVVDKCRCTDCPAAATEYARVQRRATLYGRYDSGRVDAEPVREHLRYLMDNGISVKRTAALTGLASSAVSAILYGRSERGHAPYPRVLKTTADKILAITPTLENMAPGQVVDGTGTGRRLQALVAIGWSMSRLGERLGVEIGNMGRVVAGGPVTAARALAVKALFEELWNQPQEGDEQRSRISANRARNYARARGWAPPLAWDDETIDDPAAMPEGFQETNPLVPAEDRLADIEHLLAAGVILDELVHRSGFKSFQSFEKFVYRQGRGDLATKAKGLEAAA